MRMFAPVIRRLSALSRAERVAIAVTVVLVLVSAGIVLAWRAEDAYALDEKNCLSCHSNRSLSVTKGGNRVSLYVNIQAVNTAAHRYVDCTTCHTADPHKVDTPLNKQSLAEKCGTCHKYEYKVHLESVHGQQLAKGNPDVATCVDCHSSEGNPHSVIRVLEFNASAYKKNIADTCAKCHNNERLMASYGIVEKVYESYMRSFHGKAMQLAQSETGQLDKATCTNCHGVHDIKDTREPGSQVAGLENLVSTCQQCHPGAGAEFVGGFLGHREATPKNNPTVHYTELVFSLLMKSVISVGALVVLAAVTRFGINRWRE